jgi:hypothetical protein
MNAFDTLRLIETLQGELRRQIGRCSQLREMPVEVLHQRPAAERWSVMEVLQHLNLSSGHYLGILQRLYADPNNRIRSRPTFTPGRWGDFTTKAMDPKPDGSIGWRMKTMAMFEPRDVSTTGMKALDTYEVMCQGFMDLLESARNRGLEGEKVTSTLGPILRFKLGDAFRFPIAHQQRHMLQIERVLEVVGPITVRTTDNR